LEGEEEVEIAVPDPGGGGLGWGCLPWSTRVVKTLANEGVEKCLFSTSLPSSPLQPSLCTPLNHLTTCTCSAVNVKLHCTCIAGKFLK